MQSVSVKDAQEILDIGHAQIQALVQRGILVRSSRGRLTRLSVESRKHHQDFKKAAARSAQPPSKRDKRMIVQTLLLAGVFDPRDVAAAEAERLRKAIRRHAANSAK